MAWMSVNNVNNADVAKSITNYNTNTAKQQLLIREQTFQQLLYSFVETPARHSARKERNTHTHTHIYHCSIFIQ